MKRFDLSLIIVMIFFLNSFSASAQQELTEAQKKSYEQIDTKVAEWVAELKLNDPAKEARLKEVISVHQKAVLDWHNSHSYTLVPEGVNPRTGDKLSTLDRQMIVDSSMPKSVHENLMSGLRKDLSEEQVEFIMDKYTIGKVAFTMKAYKEIVPNMTQKEEETIMGFLKQAREMAVDHKNMNQISAVFEIYKTKSEQYLNANGRNWRTMYKTYTDALKAKKAAAAK